MSILEPGIVFNFSFGEVIGKILIDLCDRVFNFWITHYALFINSNIPHKTSYSYLLHIKLGRHWIFWNVSVEFDNYQWRYPFQEASNKFSNFGGCFDGNHETASILVNIINIRLFKL